MASHVPRKVVTVLDAEVLEVHEDLYPTPEEFKAQWVELDEEEQLVVKHALANVYYKEASQAAGVHFNRLRKVLERPAVMRTYYYGKLLKLSSDVARKTFIQSLISESAAKSRYLEDVNAIVMTDKNHLKEIVKTMSFDGDGKRQQLQLIAAYGQQVRIINHPVLDEKGKELVPATVDMADPRIALTSLQELNKMDHEYGDDKTATSSIETQADRVKRIKLLADKIDKSANKAQVKLKRLSNKIAQQEFGELAAEKELVGDEPDHVREDG